MCRLGFPIAGSTPEPLQPPGDYPARPEAASPPGRAAANQQAVSSPADGELARSPSNEGPFRRSSLPRFRAHRPPVMEFLQSLVDPQQDASVACCSDQAETGIRALEKEGVSGKLRPLFCPQTRF